MVGEHSRKEAAEEFTKKNGKKVLLIEEVEPRIGEDNFLGANKEFDAICSKLSKGELRTLHQILEMVAQRGSYLGGRQKERELNTRTEY